MSRRKRQLNLKRKADEQNKKELETLRLDQQRREEEAIKRIQPVKSSAHFSLPWGEKDLHKAIPIYESLSKYTEALQANPTELFDKPAIIKADASFDAMFATTGTKKIMATTIRNFLAKFPAGEHCRTTGRTQAPCLPKHGSAELNPTFDAIVPDLHRATGQLPSLMNLRHSYHLYGWSATLVRHSWEAQFLGSIRMQTHGCCKARSLPQHIANITPSCLGISETVAFFVFPGSETRVVYQPPPPCGGTLGRTIVECDMRKHRRGATH